MSGEPDEIYAAGGALYAAVGELRPTVRCLRDDLAGAVLDLSAHPFTREIAAWRELPPPGARLVDELEHEAYVTAGDVPILIAPADVGPAAWVLAVGARAERTHDGDLWPDEEDIRRLETDRLGDIVDSIRIKAPIALQQARREPGVRTPMDAGVTASNWIVVECSEDGATYVAMDVPGSGYLGAGEARRLIAVTLASVLADEDWALCDELPSGAVDDGVVFRHA